MPGSISQWGVAAAAVGAAPVKDLVQKLNSEDPDIRTAAWRSAGDVGAPAVKSLARLMISGDTEVARAAKRGMWQIVRQCGRPGADAQRKAVNKALVRLLSDRFPMGIRHEVLWMLSEIGSDASVKPVATLLKSKDLRETARIALERIPGDASLHALTAALNSVPDDFKSNIAQSLRDRGVPVKGYPSARLTPVKKTSVKPV